uniref:Uncharacterized protein n=1 Tax=Romanomermis culicivorax TaxID=13658 RepID=A0A915L826_ROMCU
MEVLASSGSSLTSLATDANNPLLSEAVVLDALEEQVGCAGGFGGTDRAVPRPQDLMMMMFTSRRQ